MSKGCVFAKTDILSVLSLLDREYKKVYRSGNPRDSKLMKAYSKMAVIAIGGWIEDGMKDLMQLSILKLRELETQNTLNGLVARIYGFSYKSHFSQGIAMTFGAHGLEFIESKVGDSDIAILNSNLANIKIWRDEAAHSHSITIRCNPSQVIRSMNDIFPILKKVEINARKYRNKHFRINR